MLVIDADLRDGALSRRLGLAADRGGLTGVLTGSGVVAARAAAGPGPAGRAGSAAMTVLPAGGPDPARPGAALAVPRMAELLARRPTGST